MTCKPDCVRAPEHSGQCWDWLKKRDDDSLASAFAGLEHLRAAGPVFNDKLYCVARDVCLEHGVVFRITSNRKVNIKKGNRRKSRSDTTIRQLNNWFRSVYSEVAANMLPRADALMGVDASSYELWRRAALTWESDKIFAPESYHFSVQDSVTPENGFRYAGAAGGIEIVPSPFLRADEAVLINGQAFTGAVIDEHGEHLSDHATALALAAAINASPEAGAHAREVDGRVILASTPAGRISIAEHMVEHSLIYGIGAARLTWHDPVPPFRVAEQPIGRQLEQPIVYEPPSKHRRGPSRLPRFIPKQRLDGRRAR